VQRVSFEAKAGRRRLRFVALGVAGVAALAAAGCGEKSEPSIHPPTTAATTTTAPAVPTQTTTTPTQPVPTTTAPKTTP
jgi:hypothetical protein